jgi:WD40 repeat protein
MKCSLWDALHTVANIYVDKNTVVSPDGQHIAAGSWDGVVHLWDMQHPVYLVICNFSQSPFGRLPIFDAHFLGSFSLVEISFKLAYKLESPATMQIHPVFHQCPILLQEFNIKQVKLGELVFAFIC